MDVPVARRVESPAWINLRTVLGLVLFAVSLFAGRQLLMAAEVTSPIWRAARDVPSGEVIQRSDLAIADVRLPDDVAADYVASANNVVGLVAARPLSSGELIPAASVVEASAANQAAMTIPVTPEHAVGGTLKPGDRVDVFVSYNSGDLRAVTQLVLRDAEIIDVVTAGGLVVGDKAVVGVTVALERDSAKRLAFAVRNGEIDLARAAAESR